MRDWCDKVDMAAMVNLGHLGNTVYSCMGRYGQVYRHDSPV